MNNKVILFHELSKELVSEIKQILNNENHPHYELFKTSEFTFDDGLYSQYKYIPELMRINNNVCTIFISTMFICDATSTQYIGINAPDAHTQARKGIYNAYVTLDNIKELASIGVNIGNHSHSHHNFTEKQHSIRKIKEIVCSEVSKSTKFFKEHDIFVDSFAYPYNHVVPFYKLLLEKQKITKLYGKERINIEELLL